MFDLVSSAPLSSFRNHLFRTQKSQELRMKFIKKKAIVAVDVDLQRYQRYRLAQSIVIYTEVQIGPEYS